MHWNIEVDFFSFHFLGIKKCVIGQTWIQIVGKMWGWVSLQPVSTWFAPESLTLCSCAWGKCPSAGWCWCSWTWSLWGDPRWRCGIGGEGFPSKIHIFPDPRPKSCSAWAGRRQTHRQQPLPYFGIRWWWVTKKVSWWRFTTLQSVIIAKLAKPLSLPQQQANQDNSNDTSQPIAGEFPASL